MKSLAIHILNVFGQEQQTLSINENQTIEVFLALFCAQAGLPKPGDPVPFEQLFQIKPREICLYEPSWGVYVADRTFAEYQIKSGSSLVYYVFPMTGFVLHSVHLESKARLSEAAVCAVVEWNKEYYPVILPAGLNAPDRLMLPRMIFEQIAQIRGQTVLPVNWQAETWKCFNTRTTTWACSCSPAGEPDTMIKHGDFLRLLESWSNDAALQDEIVILSDDDTGAQADLDLKIEDDLLGDINLQPVRPLTVNGCELQLLRGDITRQEVDVIVNAAKSSLGGGGGVDGAVHKAAGSKLVQASQVLAPCAPGKAVLTPGFELPARWVIHTVGPIYEGGQKKEAEILAGTYQSSLEIALNSGFKSIAFPAISTGIYRYPLKEAAKISLQTIVEMLRSMKDPSLKTIQFVLMDEEAFDVYSDTLENLVNEKN